MKVTNSLNKANHHCSGAVGSMNMPCDTADLVKLRPLDENGHLVDFNDWSESWAESVAVQQGINLSPKHWQVIHLERLFYERFGFSPSMRPLIRFLRQEHPFGDQVNSAFLLRLFPGRSATLLAQIAGMPKPEHCF